MSTLLVPFETTLHVRDTCLCLHAQRAARRVARRFDEALRRFELTSGQFSLLMSLNRPVPARMGAAADLLAMDRTTLTAALKPLERRALVQVMPDPADRRSRLLSLTPAGLELLVKAVPVWHRVQAELEAGLPAGGADSLRRGLAALGQDCGAGPPGDTKRL
ncbi:MAG: MarR family transcriptional regulator [Acetobacteraceae bacterium]|nr:MarR family transcriptional regulator [Acetobacteraceae bacterium]